MNIFKETAEDKIKIEDRIEVEIEYKDKREKKENLNLSQPEFFRFSNTFGC